MKNSFFQETAEELVERLIKQNTFPFLTSHLKSRLIFHLEKFDNDNQKVIEEHPDAAIKTDDPDFSKFEKKLFGDYWKEYFKNMREQVVLSAYIILSPTYNSSNNKPKTASGQFRQKPNHLRLVVNNG